MAHTISVIVFIVAVFLVIVAINGDLYRENSDLGEPNGNVSHAGGSGTGTTNITVNDGIPTTCPLLPDCYRTGPTCITSCAGRPDGDYQSCNGCGIYASCNNSKLFDNRLCAPGGLSWDDNVKRCEWKSPTCKEHPCADIFDVDIRSGMYDAANARYTWIEAPPSEPSVNCNNSGVLQIDAPYYAKELTIFMTLSGNFSNATFFPFHIAGTPENDGFGDRGLDAGFGPDDVEVIANIGYFDVTTSILGEYMYYRAPLAYPSDGADIELCVTIREGLLLVSGDMLKVTLEHEHLFSLRKPIFVGINRPLSDVVVMLYGTGEGLCSLKVKWTK